MYKVIIVPLVVYVFSFPVTLVSIPACFLSQVSIVMNQLVCSSHTAFAFLQATVFWPFGWHSKENVGLCSLVLVSGFWCFFFFLLSSSSPFCQLWREFVPILLWTPLIMFSVVIKAFKRTSVWSIALPSDYGHDFEYLQ